MTLLPKRGRPRGQTKANGARVSPGRPLALTESEQARYQHWKKWWQVRPGGQPSARELATRMEQTDKQVQAYAAGRRCPGPVALCNLEALSGAYGYQPLTVDHQLL